MFAGNCHNYFTPVLYSYMDDNRLFSLEQYGFRTGHSTELAALHLVNHLTKQMDTGKIPINIYIDLSKAFDTHDHAIYYLIS